jgi:hypothetical protein
MLSSNLITAGHETTAKALCEHACAWLGRPTNDIVVTTDQPRDSLADAASVG